VSIVFENQLPSCRAVESQSHVHGSPLPFDTTRVCIRRDNPGQGQEQA
jgi:hypothetical protein